MIKISILIPVYNEEATIISLLKSVQKEIGKIRTVTFEIIVIDDYSRDNTSKLLRGNEILFNHMISLEKNQGKGGAILRGLEKAKGNYILFQDADMEYDPSEYEKLLEPVIKFDADIVMGSRLMTSSLTRHGGYARNRIGNNFITSLFNLLNNTIFTDIYSGYLIFRRSNITPSKLRTDGWEQQAEILSKIIRNSSKIHDVPIVYHGRTYEEGKKIKPRHILGIIGMIIREKILPTEN